MAYYAIRERLDSTSDRISIPIPQDGAQYTVVYRLAGTFVATVQVQADGSAVGTVELLATGTNIAAADPTAVGEFAADCGASAEECAIVLTAYTSGEVEVEAVLIPQA